MSPISISPFCFWFFFFSREHKFLKEVQLILFDGINDNFKFAEWAVSNWVSIRFSILFKKKTFDVGSCCEFDYLGSLRCNLQLARLFLFLCFLWLDVFSTFSWSPMDPIFCRKRVFDFSNVGIRVEKIESGLKSNVRLFQMAQLSLSWPSP